MGPHPHRLPALALARAISLPQRGAVRSPSLFRARATEPPTHRTTDPPNYRTTDLPTSRFRRSLLRHDPSGRRFAVRRKVRPHPWIAHGIWTNRYPAFQQLLLGLVDRNVRHAGFLVDPAVTLQHLLLAFAHVLQIGRLAREQPRLARAAELGGRVRRRRHHRCRLGAW